MKKLIFILLVVLVSLSFVSAETCEDLEGQVCGLDQVCEGVEVELEDGSTCCTFIANCVTQEELEDVEAYLAEIDFEGYEELEDEEIIEETQEEIVQEESSNVYIYVLGGILVLIFVIIGLFLIFGRKKPEVIQQPYPVQNQPYNS